MTPKEKAEELMNEMLGLDLEDLTKFDYIDHQAAMHFALIVVNQIIDSEPQYKWSKEYEPIDFWEEVKKEINKL